MGYNPEITQKILEGLVGIVTVQAATAFLKDKLIRLFKASTDLAKKVVGYATAGLTSAVATFAYLQLTHQFGWGEWILYVGSVWFTASKLYDIYHTHTPPPSS